MNLDYIYSDIKQPLKMVVWDLGRRCNFDCSYCTGWMHSTTSPMQKLERFKKTADFIHEYFQVHKEHHAKDWKITLSFTGGEPAVNPAFFQLLPYMREKYPYMQLNLTTNGTWGKRKGEMLLKHLDSITVSYHLEGTEMQKKLARENMLWVREQLGEAKKHKLKVNVMMHMEYWDECVDLIENFLKPNDIRYIPRTIGDDGKHRSEWFEDMDGQMRRTSHVYTEVQKDYIKNHWNKKNEEVSKPVDAIQPNKPQLLLESVQEDFNPKSDGTHQLVIPDKEDDGHVNKLGRMCCGGRCMTVKKGNQITDAMFVDQTNFKDYNCMINWFFLHIEEDRDAVYHHQTCMARFPDAPVPELDESLFGDIVHKFTPEKGPICTLSKSDEYLSWLKKRLSEPKPPSIVCPNTHCGCGVCVVKAKTKDDFDIIKTHYVTT